MSVPKPKVKSVWSSNSTLGTSLFSRRESLSYSDDDKMMKPYEEYIGV
jgi:hypothetical protein